MPRSPLTGSAVKLVSDTLGPATVYPVNDIGKLAGRIRGYTSRGVPCCNGAWCRRSQDASCGVDAVLRLTTILHSGGRVTRLREYRYRSFRAV